MNIDENHFCQGPFELKLLFYSHNPTQNNFKYLYRKDIVTVKVKVPKFENTQNKVPWFTIRFYRINFSDKCSHYRPLKRGIAEKFTADRFHARSPRWQKLVHPLNEWDRLKDRRKMEWARGVEKFGILSKSIEATREGEKVETGEFLYEKAPSATPSTRDRPSSPFMCHRFASVNCGDSFRTCVQIRCPLCRESYLTRWSISFRFNPWNAIYHSEDSPREKKLICHNANSSPCDLHVKRYGPCIITFSTGNLG